MAASIFGVMQILLLDYHEDGRIKLLRNSVAIYVPNHHRRKDLRYPKFNFKYTIADVQSVQSVY
jgi:hypothetical protein